MVDSIEFEADAETDDTVQCAAVPENSGAGEAEHVVCAEEDEGDGKEDDDGTGDTEGDEVENEEELEGSELSMSFGSLVHCCST